MLAHSNNDSKPRAQWKCKSAWKYEARIVQSCKNRGGCVVKQKYRGDTRFFLGHHRRSGNLDKLFTDCSDSTGHWTADSHDLHYRAYLLHIQKFCISKILLSVRTPTEIMPTLLFSS